ncbi:AAA family ATPase [Adhaeribacter pallidiroseus]|uniref:AAA+ ATPase domain-containing protein n=1 Tax=Adhaeribacter pallidiroseus TaxID=2072847 RepID=A0A369QKX4_9BACT|nr:ATP-binding protein [Adhaeribacter pallidiroseus]RDC65032.1 hypothetical protein AHMF7616_03655 [Adhaeribacter pallidiroseus]
MITKLSVIKLNNRITQDFLFHSDLNIISGKNGSGKTTLLKLMWYMTSGNWKYIFDEMDFDYARLDFMDGDFLELIFTEKENTKFLKINTKSEVPPFPHEISLKQLESIDGLVPMWGSLYFPTFRRIEGGYSILNSEGKRSRFSTFNLREALDVISTELNKTKHNFITSISSHDIDFLLTSKYSEISEKVRKLEDEQSKVILDIVSKSTNKEKESLESIKAVVRNNDSKKNDILKPISVLSSFVDKIFKNKSISITGNIKLGDAKEAIYSEKLSSGEKQMLSFLCYNFFYDKSIIFIDEPELSLHTDWQRLLFPTLLKQNKGNQFIIATHSPFIYSKYPDKEIIINDKRIAENA